MKYTIFTTLFLLFAVSAMAQVSVIDIDRDVFTNKSIKAISTYVELVVDIPAEMDGGYLDMTISCKNGGLVGIGYMENGTVRVCDQVWLTAGTHKQRFDISRAVAQLAANKGKSLNLAIGPVLAGGNQEILLVQDAKSDHLGALTVSRMPKFAHPVAQVDQMRMAEKAQSDDMPVVEKLTTSAYPNPFNPETTIKLDMPKGQKVVVNIYDIRGQLVNQLHSGYFGPGQHDIVWQGKDEMGSSVASGVYFYRVTAGSETRVGKLALLK